MDVSQRSAGVVERRDARARPPYELRPATGRRDPASSATRLDAPVQRLNHTGASSWADGPRIPVFIGGSVRKMPETGLEPVTFGL